MTRFLFFISFILIAFFTQSTATLAAYRYEGIGFYANTTQTESTVPVYRFYSDRTGDHFYTALDTEKTIVESNPAWGYKYEGIGFYANATQTESTVPVYRFYSDRTGDHFYTALDMEKTIVESNPAWGYKYEGIGFYANATQTESTVPVYRFYSDRTGDHFYTALELERSLLINNGGGPSISVGLWSVPRTETQNTPFNISANKNFSAFDKNNTLLENFDANTIVRVSYNSSGALKITSDKPTITTDKQVFFRASDGINYDTIFDVNKPNSSFDHYRSTISVRYSSTSKNVWIINTLPLEQYLWGMGEITGTGSMEYNKAMVTAFRTYGLWKIYYSTKYATEGFTVDATPGNQVYYGYDWKTHLAIQQAAQSTSGLVMKSSSDIALSPYSSWTDGRTRSFQERWGSSLYPWCQSVADSYGKHPTLSTTELVSQGNHMVGISAHGALSLAKNHQWTWDNTYVLLI